MVLSQIFWHFQTIEITDQLKRRTGLLWTWFLNLNVALKKLILFLPDENMCKIYNNTDAATVCNNFQLKLLDLQSDVELKEVFKSKSLLNFCSRVSEGKYSNLIDNALKNTSILV